jgi:outer membrane receptor protein involved in Fe transport
MKDLSSAISYLKLRGSFGPAGNSSAIINYMKYDYIGLTNNSNDIAVYPDRYREPGNPNIKWEETFTVDMGVELRMLKERIAITADYYNRNTTNLIASKIPLGLATGFYSFSANVGDVKNTGIELSLSADLVKSNTFRWNMIANWSKNKNKLTKSNFPIERLTSTGVANKVGEEYNSFYMPRWAGVSTSNGRPQWIDSLTGKPTEDYNASKPEIVGKAQPDGFGAIINTISFKNIELSAMINYQYGLQIYRDDRLQNDGRIAYLNQSRSALNRWQKPGDVAINPRRLLDGRTGGEVDAGYNTSTRFLFDGDMIRLANVAIAYNFPKALLSNLHLQTLKVFAQGHNLGTWTKYSGQDPESTTSSGAGYLLYPQARSFSLGLNVTF